MTDSARRREGIRSAVAATRAEATALRDRIVDAQSKTLLTPVFHQLDDVDSVFLSDGEDHAQWWFDVAERFLQAARTELHAISELLQKYGGPEKVRTVS